jgi:2-dehydro-3-deoxyphosphooctonate aldolase (KDO 8-P synthase)
MGDSSGGQPEFIAPLARAAVATGVISAVFMEVHPDPSKALSDATTQLPLHKFPTMVEELLTIYEIVS